MCGRYHLNATPVEVGRFFDVDVRKNFPPRYNIAPTQAIAAIRMNEKHEREFALLRWGFVPSWAKGDYLKKLASRPLINARAETAHEKPTFRSAFKRRRCLIPANGFYEWKKEENGKQPFAIQRPGGALFGFAGIWETARDDDGGEVDTAAILTTAAGTDLKPIHHREPVVIEKKNFEAWLETDETSADILTPLLSAPKKGMWRTFPVSKAVNSPRNEGAELIEPIRGD